MSTHNQRCFNVKFRHWFYVDKLTLFRRWNTRGVAIRGGGVDKRPYPPHFNLRTKQAPTVAVSNIRDIAFYGYSEIIRNRISRFLLCMLEVLNNLRWLFIFSNYIGEIDHFTLDLLERSDTWPWTYRKVSHCRPSERRSQWTRISTLDYRQNPGPTEKVLLNKRNLLDLLKNSSKKREAPV